MRNDLTSENLIKAVAVTAELTRTELSVDGLRAIVSVLQAYPEQWVMGALKRCQRECRFQLTLADILQRLEDGRPSAEEAWAMMPRSESQTVVWSQEMQEAYGIVAPIMDDHVQARMAFKDAYSAAVTRARDTARPAQWTATLGHDPHGRETPILEAVKAGRLTADHAAALLPYRDAPSAQVKALLDKSGLLLPDESKRLQVRP